MEKGVNFQDTIDTTEKLLLKDHVRVGVKKLDDNTVLFIGRDYAYDQDPVISDVTFYLLKNGEKSLRKFYKDPGVKDSDITRPHNSVTYPEFDFGKLEEREEQIVIPVKMVIKQEHTWDGNDFLQHKSIKEIKQTKFEIKFEK